MRKLKMIKVSGDGLKGRTFEERLSGCDVFVGPNASGKTARLLAITAALRGLSEASPDLKKGADGREYLGPERPDTQITLVWDDSSFLTRDIAKVRGKDCDRATYEAERIAGPHVVRFDLADFAAMSDTARAKLLEQAAAVAGQAVTVAEVLDRLGKLVTEATPYPVDEMLGRVRPGDSTSVWLRESLAWVTDQFTEANRVAKTYASAADAANTALAAGAPAGTLAQARTRLAAVESELAEAIRAVQAEEHLALRTTRAEEERARLVNTVALLTKTVADAEAFVETCRKAVADANAYDDGGRAEAVARVDAEKAAKVEEEALATVAIVKASMETARSDHMRSVGRAAAIGDLVLDEATSTCADCGAADPLRLKATLAMAEDLAARSKAVYEDADADLVLADGSHKRAMEKAREAKRLYQEATNAYRDGAREAREAQARLVTAEADLRKQQDGKERAEAELRGWQAQEEEDRAKGPQAAGDVEAMKQTRDALVEQVKLATVDVEAHVRHSERQKAANEAVARREAAQTRLALIKGLKEALLTEQVELARQAYGPIAEEANRFLSMAGVVERVHIASESDFGAWVTPPSGFKGPTTKEGLVYAPFWSASASEKALVGSALAVAFARLLKAPWTAVLLDGLEVVDEARRPGVLSALSRMVADNLIDNAVCTMHLVPITGYEALGKEGDGILWHWVTA